MQGPTKANLWTWNLFYAVRIGMSNNKQTAAPNALGDDCGSRAEVCSQSLAYLRKTYTAEVTAAKKPGTLYQTVPLSK